MRKHLWGGVLSLLIMIAGLWLMEAPFAFGYQPGGTAWTASTAWDFWLGLGIAVVSALGVALFALSALAELRRLGVIQPRPKPQPVATPAAPLPAMPTPTTTADLERVLLPMATALLADIAERRRAGGAAPATEHPGSPNGHSAVANGVTVAPSPARKEGDAQ